MHAISRAGETSRAWRSSSSVEVKALAFSPWSSARCVKPRCGDRASESLAMEISKQSLAKASKQLPWASKSNDPMGMASRIDGPWLSSSKLGRPCWCWGASKWSVTKMGILRDISALAVSKASGFFGVQMGLKRSGRALRCVGDGESCLEAHGSILAWSRRGGKAGGYWWSVNAKARRSGLG